MSEKCLLPVQPDGVINGAVIASLLMFLTVVLRNGILHYRSLEYGEEEEGGEEVVRRNGILQYRSLEYGEEEEEEEEGGGGGPQEWNPSLSIIGIWGGRGGGGGVFCFFNVFSDSLTACTQICYLIPGNYWFARVINNQTPQQLSGATAAAVTHGPVR